jgi:hypothetical protein
VSLISLFFATILVSIHCARGGGRNHCQEDEDEDDITTDSGDESDARFDYDSESSFDDDVDGDEDEQDEDMEWFQSVGEAILLPSISNPDIESLLYS